MPYCVCGCGQKSRQEFIDLDHKKTYRVGLFKKADRGDKLARKEIRRRDWTDRFERWLERRSAALTASTPTPVASEATPAKKKGSRRSERVMAECPQCNEFRLTAHPKTKTPYCEGCGYDQATAPPKNLPPMVMAKDDNGAPVIKKRTRIVALPIGVTRSQYIEAKNILDARGIASGGLTAIEIKEILNGNLDGIPLDEIGDFGTAITDEDIKATGLS